MSQLILMRHGNTFEAEETPRQVGLRTDLPLTAFGRTQAEQMLRFLQSTNFCPTAIFAGSLKRQVESAGIIAKGFGLEVQQTFALNEIDYGAWEGLTQEEIQEKWPQEYAAWGEGKWQGAIFGSTFEEHLERLQKWFSQISLQGTVFACTSNGVLRFLKNEKVKTGHYCKLFLNQDGYVIEKWNQKPVYRS